MNYQYAVSSNMFLCYDRNKEIVAYLHEIPLNVNRLSIQRNKAIIQATYAWSVLPEDSQLILCTSEDTIKPATVGKNAQGLVYTYEVILQKKKQNIRAYWEYKNMRGTLDIQLSDKMKKDLLAGLLVKGRMISIWKKDILYSLKWRVRRLLKR